MARGKGTKNKKSYEELEAELRFQKRVRRSETIAVLGQSAFKWGGLAYIAYCTSQAVSALAGQATVTNIAIELLGNMHVSVALAWVFGIVAIIYGLGQRKLRKDVIERLAGRNASLEREIDSRRSSSLLTVRGDTPEDAI